MRTFELGISILDEGLIASPGWIPQRKSKFEYPKFVILWRISNTELRAFSVNHRSTRRGAITVSRERCTVTSSVQSFTISCFHGNDQTSPRYGYVSPL